MRKYLANSRQTPVTPKKRTPSATPSARSRQRIMTDYDPIKIAGEEFMRMLRTRGEALVANFLTAGDFADETEVLAANFCKSVGRMEEIEEVDMSSEDDVGEEGPPMEHRRKRKEQNYDHLHEDDMEEEVDFIEEKKKARAKKEKIQPMPPPPPSLPKPEYDLTQHDHGYHD